MAQLHEQTRWIIRRSKLMVGPDDDHAIDVAMDSGADAVVLDMSGSDGDQEMVPIAGTVKQTVGKLAHRGMDILVWLNEVTAIEDLEELVEPGLTGVLLLTESQEDVWKVDRALTTQEVAKGIPVGTIQMELVISSARAVFDLFCIVGASPRIVCLNLATSKLATEMGVEESGMVDQFLYARGRLLMAARLFGVEAHSLAFVPAERDGGTSSLEKRASLANRMGYRGALCSNPLDVPLLNNSFKPTEEEMRYAEQAREAMEGAIRQGKGAATLRSGTLVDMAMLRHSEALLSWNNAVVEREQAKKNRS